MVCYGLVKTKEGKFDFIGLVTYDHIGSYSRQELKQTGSKLFLQVYYKSDYDIGEKSKHVTEVVKKLNNNEIKISDLEKEFKDADKVTEEFHALD